jgi:hypothetical protein
LAAFEGCEPERFGERGTETRMCVHILVEYHRKECDRRSRDIPLSSRKPSG